MTIKDRDFDRLIGKLGFETRENDHLFAWFEHEGRVIVRTRRSHQRGDLPMQDSIRQQMKLNENQVREAISCSFGVSEYVAHLRARGLIADSEAEGTGQQTKKPATRRRGVRKRPRK